MQQPLSYQTLTYSCWVTSVTNALLCLFGDKDKIPGFVLRLLHSVLTDQGVGGGGRGTLADWQIVVQAVAARCKVDCQNYSKQDVEIELASVDFTNSVVVCDIAAGSHSILVNGREDEWFLAFDPDWNQVKSGKSIESQYEIFPKVAKSLEGRVNVRIHRDHPLSSVASKHCIFGMGGVATRNISVLRT